MKGMNTQTMYKANKSILLTLCLIFMGTLNVLAKDYGFKVAGKMVTSDNCNNIPHVSGVFDSGTAKYVESTNTLTLTNCTITRTGGNNHAIENNSCEGLIIKCVGTNNLSSESASAVRFETKGTLEVVSGTTTLSSVNYEGIYLKNAKLRIKGPGNLTVKSTNDCAIEGNIDNYPRSNVEFWDGITATISGPKGDLVDLDFAYVNNESCEVTLKATNNSSCPNVKNTYVWGVNLEKEAINDYFSHSSNDDPVDYVEGAFPVILQPFGATCQNNSDYTKRGVTYNGSHIYNQNIVVSSRWAVLLIPEFFPDTNFLSYLKTTKFPNKNYLTESEVAGCTTLSMNSKSISSLKGIRFFPALEKLYCSSNNLTELDLSDNTELTELYCSNNKLSKLTGICSKITKINCSNNKFETLSINSKNSLTSLICSNNSSLKTLNCYYDKLTTLDCTNCGNLTTLKCYSNNLTALDLTGCPKLASIDCRANQFEDLTITGFQYLKTLDCRSNQKLEYLTCYSNVLTSLSVDYCKNLIQINCDDNQFTSLSITGLESLIALSCSDNTKLKTLDCYGNALCDDYLQIYGCTALETLNCYNNQLKTIDLSDCTNLKSLDCNNNQLTGLSVSNNISLQYIDCSNNCIDGLLKLWACSNLSKLNCSNNNISSLLTHTLRLEELQCQENQIVEIANWIDPGENQPSPFAKSITCYSNKLSGEYVDKLIGLLPDRMSQSESGELRMISPASGSEHNVITKEQVQAAWSKNWKTYQFVNGSWTYYEGSSNGISTDITPIGNTMDEATPLYNLSGQRVGSNYKGVVITKDKKVRMK